MSQGLEPMRLGDVWAKKGSKTAWTVQHVSTTRFGEQVAVLVSLGGARMTGVGARYLRSTGFEKAK